MKLDIYQDKAGGWRWRFISRNGRNVASSGQSFASRRGARASAHGVIDAMIRAAAAEVVKPAATVNHGEGFKLSPRKRLISNG